MGTLNADNIPWTQPAFAPLYPKEAFPVLTRDTWQLMVLFETDAEFVDSQLPVGVEMASDPPVATVWYASHENSTLGGPYQEVAAGVNVTFEGKDYFYPFAVYLNDGTEEIFAAGREVWGHQKKLGHVGISAPQGSGIITAWLERPKGSRLLEISVGPFEREVAEDEASFLPVLSLRVIPDPEKPKPQMADLVVTECELAPRRASDGHLEFWAGPGQVAYPVPSERDPLHRLTVSRVIGAYYGCFDGITAPFGKIVKQLIP